MIAVASARKRIAVTMRIIEPHEYHDPRDAISHDMIRWLEELGYIPFPVPNAAASPEQYLDLLNADALVFSGGNDLLPDDAGSAASELRIASELRLMRAAMERSLPILGICRGLHLINHYFGGSLRQQVVGAVRHVAANHPVTLASPFKEIASAVVIETNSFHTQGVGKENLATGVCAFAWSEQDGVVEGLYHPERPVLAMQWHPERPNPARTFDRQIVDRLINQGAFWSS